ncbi:BREX-1 system adenine-specific DNA-methyltransferase PglX [Lactiplantibacillus pentosus]|uniref:BREX-1 system adenine-specific DNA-methyltransferase PglX n=1 Tax=Lactiplantibacillus pentosus TaxID=1589 RepID=UPI00132FD0C7|nr:BREX-1 system adenine-specific DNA-methyltransferase PglX [Lactiplantibacillus pentosus]MBU7492537.1 BREX-1 system adenine-specific DNA-methyltransferase PglX [Lactiplantibacillus pentosus]MBU7518403.1 BREX-1 system adenine-specific DNA-methyltransferase PglX [Lactiplantibacillus pentosus]
MQHLIHDISEADFDVNQGGQVEIIGWLYQYYNTEPKDLAFKKRKYSESDIPAVTQLFTPDWIVKYMVENSLGRYWIDVLQAKGDQRSESEIAENYQWHYYMPEAQQSEKVLVEIAAAQPDLTKVKLKDISLIDPAMGSGHVLVYAFDVFVQLYESEGYSRRDAAKDIIQHNLYGFDIDTRAFQLAYFALCMKAREYNRRFLTLNTRPNVFDIPEYSDLSATDFEELVTSDTQRSNIACLLDAFHDGNSYGSLIHFSDSIDWQALESITEIDFKEQQLSFDTIEMENKKTKLKEIIEISKLLCRKYTIGVMNPPYMGSGKMNDVLGKYVKKHFPAGKADLFGAFMQRLRMFVSENSYYAMITQHAWMFLSSFEKLRQTLTQDTLINMAHLGTRAFEEIGGEVVQSTTFVSKKQSLNDYVGTYERLINFNSQSKKEKAYLTAVRDQSVDYLYRTNQANFGKIPGSPIAYWVSDNFLNAFKNFDSVSKHFESTGRLKTHNNVKYIRYWWEIDSENDDWIVLHNGGEYRKYFGNEIYVVDYSKPAINFYSAHGGMVGNNSAYSGITWNLITSANPGFRLKEANLPNSSGAPTIVPSSHDNADLLSLLGFLNSNVCLKILNVVNPTLNTNVSNIMNLPYPYTKVNTSNIVKDCVSISTIDWNTFEISEDFSGHPLLSHIADDNLSIWYYAMVLTNQCAKNVPIFQLWGVK